MIGSQITRYIQEVGAFFQFNGAKSAISKHRINNLTKLYLGINDTLQ